MITKYVVLAFATILLVRGASLKDAESTTTTTTEVGTSSTGLSFSSSITPRSTTENQATSTTNEVATTITEPQATFVTTEVPTTTTENPKNKASEIYNELKSKVFRAMDDSELALKQITWSAITFSSNGTKNIEETYNKYEKIFNSLKEQYAQLGVDISGCNNQVEPGFARQKRYLLDRVNRAVVHEVDVIYNYHALKTVRDISNQWIAIRDFGKDLARCGSNSVCVNNVLAILETQSGTISARIDDDLSLLKQYQEEYTISAELAIDARLSEIINGGNQNVETIRACAENLVNKPFFRRIIQ